MAKTITRQPLPSKASFRLENINGMGFVSGTNPVKHSLEDNDAKTFSGLYLNDTCFDWQYTHNAVVAPRKSSLTNGKRHA